jgi:hypothetical protein
VPTVSETGPGNVNGFPKGMTVRAQASGRYQNDVRLRAAMVPWGADSHIWERPPSLARDLPHRLGDDQVMEG